MRSLKSFSRLIFIVAYHLAMTGGTPMEFYFVRSLKSSSRLKFIITYHLSMTGCHLTMTRCLGTRIDGPVPRTCAHISIGLPVVTMSHKAVA